MKMNDLIMKNGYIVHRPTSNGNIGMLFKGWDASGEKYIFGHNNGMIFVDHDSAHEVSKALGDDWQVKKLSDLTAQDLETMDALAAIFD